MDRLTRRQLAATAALVALAAGVTLALSPRRVLAEVAALSERPVLFGGALIVLYLFRPLVAWPISPISALVGYVLGVAVGVPVALVGATATCLLPFLFARRLGDRGGLLGRCNQAGRRVVEVTGETRGVLAARLSPLPADPVSYGAGLSGVSTRAFVLGTFVGEIPWVILEVLVGASAREIATVGVDAGLQVLLASFAVALLLLAGPAYRHAREETPS